jgi:hypothetical protein
MLSNSWVCYMEDDEKDSGPDADEMGRDFHSAIERIRRNLVLGESDEEPKDGEIVRPDPS